MIDRFNEGGLDEFEDLIKRLKEYEQDLHREDEAPYEDEEEFLEDIEEDDE